VCVATPPLRGGDRSEEAPMADLAYGLLLVAAFAVLVLVLRGLEGL
jgi:hypothetical protein